MPFHRECKEKKIVQLTPSMILSSMTVPDYGNMCPNFSIGENLKIPNPWPLIGPETLFRAKALVVLIIIVKDI